MVMTGRKKSSVENKGGWVEGKVEERRCRETQTKSQGEGTGGPIRASGPYRSHKVEGPCH